MQHHQQRPISVRFQSANISIKIVYQTNAVPSFLKCVLRVPLISFSNRIYEILKYFQIYGMPDICNGSENIHIHATNITFL